MSAPLRPFFSFYGGKWRDALRNYPPPAHSAIVEPFAGSAGYSLRYPDRDVLLVDRDPIIASLWEYLIAVSPEEILAIPNVPLDGSVDDLNLPQESAWLVGFWLNRGASAPRKTPSRWMREEIRPGSFWGDRVRRTIAGQLDAIRHWKIIHGDYTAAPDRPATWFIDPPYQRAGRHYRYGASQIDYDHLSSWCSSRPGQVIVCEQADATWLPFQALKDTKTTRRAFRSAEAIWVGAA